MGHDGRQQVRHQQQNGTAKKVSAVQGCLPATAKSKVGRDVYLKDQLQAS